jgi:hypothetical protein
MSEPEYTDLEPPGQAELDPLRQTIAEEFALLPDSLKRTVLEIWRLMRLTCPPRVYRN